MKKLNTATHVHFYPAPPSQEEVVTAASSKEKDSKNVAKSAKTVAVQTKQR